MHPFTFLFLLTGTGVLVVVGEWQAALVVWALAALFVTINFATHWWGGRKGPP